MPAKHVLTRSLIHHFETIPNSKKLQTTTKLWLSEYFKDCIEYFKDCTDCIENIVEKGEIAHFEQFHLFPQCFPKAFSFSVLK